MFSKTFKYLKKLSKDRVFRKSILHFTAFFAVVATFVVLTTNHVITRQPQSVLPAEYSALSGSETTVMSKTALEQTLRSEDRSEVQGLIFFKGLNSIVIQGNGLEHDKLVVDADVDEMRKLAVKDKLPITEKSAELSTQIQDLLPGWWWVIAITLGCWLIRMLVFKREKGQVYSRARVFLSAIPDVMNAIVKASKLKPSRFYLYLLAALVVINGGAFALHMYHTDSLYVLPSEMANEQRIQPWQVTRHLETHPEEFQRVSFVPELNTAYIVLNSRSVPIKKSAHDFSDDDDSVSVSATDSMGAPVAPAQTVNPRGGVTQPTPPKTVVTVGLHKPVLVDRTVEFGNGAEGKAAYTAFVAQIEAQKVESKIVSAKHETGYIESLTVRGRIIMGILLGLTVLIGGYVMLVWSDWKDKETPRAPGEVYNPRLVGAGATGGGGAPIVTRDEDRKTFADVAGCQEAIDELQVVKKKIMRPKLYKIFGAPVPSGVILYGPPGTGKTLLARALAGEVGGSFQAMSGSEFVEMYVGVGAKRVREAYAKARADARKTGRISIVFIDEFDALAKKRGNSSEGGNREYEQTLNQLLVEMNGFGNHGLVLTMAATNRLDILDEAVLRPGRFDIKVKVPKPDKKGRALIYGIYLKKLKLVLEGDTDETKAASLEKLLEDLAKRSHDFSGAEIEGSIKDGATIAVERQFGDVLEDITSEQEEEYRNRAIITADDLHLGIDKMAYGTQIRSRVRTDKERKATAIHEIGHACIPTICGGDKVNRITIVMTDKSLGLMDSSPEEGERYDWTDEQFIIRLKMMLAGRAAEKVLLNKISTGASNDFERASGLARQMVGVYGMSEAFGNKSIPLDQHGFPVSNIGENMLQKFNDAWGKIIDDMQAETERLIKEHEAQIEYCAQHLYDDETLTGDEFRRLWAEKAQIDKDAKDEADKAKSGDNTEPKGDVDAQQ